MPFYNRPDIQQQTKQKQADNYHGSFWGRVTDPNNIGDFASTAVNAVAEPYERVSNANARVIDSLTTKTQDKADQSKLDEASSLSKLRQTILNNSVIGKGPVVPSYDNLNSKDKAAYDDLTKRLQTLQSSNKASNDKVIDATDPTKYAGAAAQIGLDAATAGAGGALAKGAKTGADVAEGGLSIANKANPARTAADILLNPKGAAQATASGAALGAAYGGAGAVEQNGATTNAADIVGGALPGAALGGGLGLLLGTLSSRIANSRNRAKSPTDDIKAAELPFFQHTQRLTPDQQDKVTAALQADPVLTNRALNMSEDEAKNFTDTLIEGPKPVKTVKGGKSEVSTPAPEAATNPFTRPEQQMYEANTITPSVSAIPDLEAAASTNNPAEFLRNKQEAAVPTTTSFAPLDEGTQAKVDTLKQESTNTPIRDGFTRLYQTNDSATQKSDQYFKDPDTLANYTNGRSDNATLDFVDVPDSAVQSVPGKPQVFKLDNKVMAAEVTPQADIGEVSMDLSPAEQAAKALNNDKTPIKTAKPGNLAVIGNVDPDLAREIGIDTGKLDPEVAKAVTYMTQGKVGSDASEKLTKSIGRYMSDSIGYATRTLGETGAQTAESLIRGSKVKADMKADVRPMMVNVMKLSKSIAGKTETARIQTGSNIVKALEDRDNVEKYITDPDTRKLYDNIVSIFDNIKQKMIDNGMPVRDNYSPWNMLKDYSESPSYLESGLTDKKTRVVSGNAQERRLDEKPELTNNNILEVLPRYVDGMINHIAFTPTLDAFSDALTKVPAHIRANTSQFNDGIQYLNKMLANGISQGSSSTADKWIKGLQNNAYNGFLWNNPKNAAFALAQKLLAVGDVSKEGRAVAKQFDKDDLKIVDSKAWFGDRSVSADIAGGDEAATEAGKALQGSKLGQALHKYDINRWGEQKSVEGPFRTAFAQGLSNSNTYRQAIADGKTSGEAIKIALKDPDALALAERSGNIQVNNTAFGANSLARPEFLRDSSAIKRAVTMFMRFPLGISNFVRDTIQIKDARALDVIQRGDPRATSIANMRGEYKAYLKGLKDVQTAVKGGKAPADAPSPKVIAEHIGLVEDNIKTIDNTIKNLSTLRGTKRTAALGAMWAATAAIQFAWDGIASSIDNATGGDSNSPTVAGSLGKTDPTVASLVNPWSDNSKVRAGFNSPLNPIDKYGKVSSRNVLNLIPGAGAVNRLSGNRISGFIDDKLAGK